MMTQMPFVSFADSWWDKDGPFKTLHDINPLRLDYIQSFVDLENKKVLDLGCGGGILTEALAKNKAQTTGLDIEPSLIEIASQHAKLEGLDIVYLSGAFETQKLKNLDVIVSMEMLEHVEDPKHILHHCFKALKKGGYLFLSTINRSFKAYVEVVLMCEYVLKLLPKQTHDYESFIKPSELHERLIAEGFEIVDLKGMSYQPWSRTAKLCQSVAVNYFMVAKKP
jgi:2-polyprenyl-6-hydroxyphenyl methylase/3-demethylubiquinone-9 3-methyltransferase